ELGLALTAFGDMESPTLLQDLALVKRLQAAAALPISALLGCIDKLGTSTWTDYAKEGSPIESAPYDSVFQRPSLRSLDHFDDFSIDKVAGANNIKISDSADFVAASLGLSSSQVSAWVNDLGVEDAVKLDGLSRLYAAALMCRALGIAP